MTNKEWNLLLDVLDGKKVSPLPCGFIIDSPWIPGWNGISTLEYFSSNEIWLKSNFKVVDTFPNIMFLPGFWSEYGMCTEPSAFGSKMIWDEYELPHPGKTIQEIEMIDVLSKPNVEKDGLLPFVVKRLQLQQSEINEKGHSIKFATSRGPLNIASFLMGNSEFMLALIIAPDRAHKLLALLSDFIIDWLKYQIKLFPSIEGIFLLDDMVGFVSDNEFSTFVFPYLKLIFQQFNVPVKFFHNDAEGLICAKYLEEIGVNLFNFSYNHSLEEVRTIAGKNITLLGNIPPRDVLAHRSKVDVENAVKNSLLNINDKRRIIMSCGGGMPPNVKTDNIRAFVSEVKKIT